MLTLFFWVFYGLWQMLGYWWSFFYTQKRNKRGRTKTKFLTEKSLKRMNIKKLIKLSPIQYNILLNEILLFCSYNQI